MSIENDTLLDVVIKDGQLFKRVYRNGEEVLEPVQEHKEEPSKTFSERFANTETIPQDWIPPDENTQILKPHVEKHTRHGLTRAEHVDRSLRVEAILVKAFSPRMRLGHVTETIDTNGNGALKELLVDLCKAMGEPWTSKIPNIK